MSLKRATAPLVSVLRNLPSSSTSRPSINQVCFQCYRDLSHKYPQISVSRRHLATATAYQPRTLDTTPPPRNIDVPNTSISGPQSQSNPSQHLSPLPIPSTLPNKSAKASLNEAEAQISRPIQTQQSTSDPSQSTSQAKTRRSKLRARKAAMTLTPAAVSQLRELLDQPSPQLIRVGVKNRGCSGLAYNLEFVDKPGAFDESVDQDGVKVLIDSKALFSIIGSEMDWIEDKLSRRFVFRNPNITEQCGCGESFSIS